jgi:alkylation response protein AidB-like acyl-CoA dehydrogenase
MEVKETTTQNARDELSLFQDSLKNNAYDDQDYQHTIQLYNKKIHAELESFGNHVTNILEPLVNENNLPENLPRLERYNAVGECIDNIIHHPTYLQAGNLIYQTGLLKRMSKPGGLLECLAFFFLSSQAGEAGHNCPIACSAGIIRVLQKTPNFTQKNEYLDRLIDPDFETNYTGAQFLTEIQGGSDVGLNTTYAVSENDTTWRIYGEKWFCSNAGADLFFVTARYNQEIPGTKGLGLFLVPAQWNNKKNHYVIRRLKNKLGTRSMATGEIDFTGAYAISIGSHADSFHLVMANVLHLSRLFNTVCVLGMARRAYHIAWSYAHHRIAFSRPIIQYPLVTENLARIKAENTAMISAIFATTQLQDQLDKNELPENTALLLRLLVNMQKYFSGLLSFNHIHHAIDVLAGNGMIETFSPLPRLLRDTIVCENWEGTHNVLRMQVLKDILKYNIDKIYVTYLNSEIEKIKKHPQAKILIEKLSLLEKEMNQFRLLNAELQAINIRHLMDSMIELYCALTLLMEALDQQKNQNSTSKLDCYHLFCKIYFSDISKSVDEEYMQLMKRIICF